LTSGGIIKPRQLTTFWHRRISEAIFTVAITLVGLFAWGYFGGATSLNSNLVVPMIPGVLAGLTAVITALLYFFTPANRKSTAALASYLLLIATLFALLYTTHGLESAFLPLFVASLPFGIFFGLAGACVSFAAIIALLVWEYFVIHIYPSQLTALSVIAFVPFLAGLFVWSKPVGAENTETKEERSYKELANELSQVAGKSEVVINAITDGVLALDGQGVIQLINPAAQEMIGWGKHDAINLAYKSVLKIINAKNSEVSEQEDPVAQVLTLNKPLKNDTLSIQTQSGKSFLASLSVSPIGQLGNGVIVVFRDITTEKSDERQRSEFISTASHEMRTPVASIEGYLGLALNPATAQIDEKARDFITKAHESAQHLGRLFQDLLDVSKADDGRLQNTPTVIDVVPFLHEIVQGLTPKAIEKGLRILYRPMPDGLVEENRRINPVFYVNADRDHLREVSNNLIENAIKYTPKGDVIVDVTGDTTHVVLSVIDTGIGIPREDQAHLFQKFYRVDNSDTRQIGGTGLGLYLCRRLVETMGGRIWVDSEYKKGSTFFVELARLDHDEATRLIEQASILAEQNAAQEAAEAERDAAAKQASEVAAMNAAPVFTPPAPVQPVEPVAPQQIVVAPTFQPVGGAASTAPVFTPTPAPAPAGVPSAPVIVPGQSTQPNTTLANIEANPSKYLAERPAPGNMSVPPRQQ
jgi:PAS domain S-box-containing protein